MKEGLTSEKQRELSRRMQELGIYEHDLEEMFIRSSGPGGQNVNKVATCVYLKHLPTGIIVKAQMSRSQGENRLNARRLLVEAVRKRKEAAIAQEIQAFEKLRRQKRKRSKLAKEKMLEKKHFHSEKKKGRAKIKHNQTYD